MAVLQAPDDRDFNEVQNFASHNLFRGVIEQRVGFITAVAATPNAEGIELKIALSPLPVQLPCWAGSLTDAVRLTFGTVTSTEPSTIDQR